MANMDYAKLRSMYKTFPWGKSDNPYFVRLSEGVYNGEGFGWGNVGVVITDEGVVVIDATVSANCSNNLLKKIRELTDAPIKYLIYTHGHYDHTRGAETFVAEGAKIIAHENVIKRFDRYRMLDEQFKRINEQQFRRNIERIEYIYPDIVFRERYTFELGGKTFMLIHGKGETDDHLVVYLPEDRVFFAGDFILWAFPNIGNPNKVIRYEREWYEMLEWMQKMDPVAIGPGHGPALVDKDLLDQCLKDTIGALKYLHHEVVKKINAGMSLEDILYSTTLPDDLANSPFIMPIYGCADFAIRGIYRRYCGWFDGNPTNLKPARVKEVNRLVLALIGNKQKVLDKVKELIDQQEYQLGLHLVDILLYNDGKCAEAHGMKADMLETMGQANRKNLFYGNFYLGSAKKEKEKSKK